MSYLQNLPLEAHILLIGFGFVLCLWSIKLALQARHEPDGTTQHIRQLIWLGRGLRAFLTGLCLMGLGFGAMYAIYWLMLASIAIGLEELYEVSTVLGVLRHAEKKERTATPVENAVEAYIPENDEFEEFPNRAKSNYI